MGTLFDDDLEYPDYQPMPTVWLEECPTCGRALAAVLIAGVVHGICPANHEAHTHSPHHEYVQLDMRTPAAAVSTMTANPFFASYDNSSNVVIQNAERRRRAQVAATSSGYFGPPLPLLESTCST